MKSCRDIIRLLDLKPHPEGGHYRETWRGDAALGERGAGTAIYYLLGDGEISHWHRIDADEIWLWHAGAALDLGLSHDGRHVDMHRLGGDLEQGERPPVNALSKKSLTAAGTACPWQRSGRPA